MNKEIIIDSEQFGDLDGFYKHIYSQMTLYPDWYPAHNLDALNDMLYSGFGSGEVTIFWKNSGKSMNDLGLGPTLDFYQKKIDHGLPYNVEWAIEKIEELKRNDGGTLFNIILSIFREHKNITVNLG